MSREDESLPENHLSDPTTRLERGVDHNGEPQWYISTGEAQSKQMIKGNLQ